MQVNSAYRAHGPQGLQGPHFSRPVAPSSTTQGARGTDQVDISAAGEAAALAGESSDFRADLVARIRSEIASGTYETAKKLDVAVDRLLDEMG